MATTSGASALAARRPHADMASRSRWPTGHLLLTVVGQLSAFVWGEPRPARSGSAAAFSSAPLTSLDSRRRAEIAAITGPVAVDAHPAPTPPGDKRTAVAHYRALAEQVAYERRCAGAPGRQPRRATADA